MSLDDLFSQIQAGNLKELNIIVKADVQGSVEAVKQSLLKLSNEEVVVNESEIITTPIEIQTVASEDISNVNRINGSVKYSKVVKKLKENKYIKE